MLTTPFTKGQNYSKWSQQDKDRWKTAGFAAQDKLDDALRNDVAKNPQADFFYWLGLRSLQLAWGILIDVNNLGIKVSEVKPSVKSALNDLIWVRDNKLMQTLTPEVAAAVKAITAMRSRLDDPIEGITKSDINKMAEYAQIIRDAAKEGKLVR